MVSGLLLPSVVLLSSVAQPQQPVRQRPSRLVSRTLSCCTEREGLASPRVVLSSLRRLRGGSQGGSSGGTDWRFFVAGGISAALSHGYTTPIDVVKTRMQTNPELYNGSMPVAVRDIIAKEGVGFLLQGLGPTFIGYGIEGALKFGTYELCKPLFARATSHETLNMLLASSIAGALASIVLCPAEEVRIRMVADPTYASSAGGALMRLTSEKGPLASFLGFPAMCAKQVPYTIGKQVSFDKLCRLAAWVISSLLRHTASDGASPIHPLAIKFAPAIAAFCAAIVAAVLSHPGDTLLTAYYKGSSTSLVASLRQMMADSGVLALFVGLKARLVHVIGIIWVQLVIYDRVKQMLGLPSTAH